MKKISILIPAALAISILTIGSITAFAATGNEESATAPPFGSGREHRMFMEDSADFMLELPADLEPGVRPELTDEQKAEMTAEAKERLALLLDEGKVSQDEYEQALANLADGKMMMHFGWGIDLPDSEMPELTDEQKAERTAKAKECLAKLLDEGKISQEEYEQAIADLAEGKMMMHFGRGMGSPDGERPEPPVGQRMKMEM